MNALEVYRKMDNLRQDKGWSTNYLCQQAGVSSNTFYNWRTRDKMPTYEVFEALCDALQVSVVQILSDGNVEDLPEEHKRVLELWSTLDKKDKELVINMMKSLRK